MGYTTYNGFLKWPQGQLPYSVEQESFPPGSAELAIITNAVNSWNTALTAARLIERTDQPDYVLFVPDEAQTASSVGRRGGRQEVKAAYFPNLTPGGYVATIRQGPAQVDCLYFDTNGTLRVSWVAGSAGTWQGPLGLTAPGAAPAGAPLVAFAQTPDQVDVAFVDRNGVVQVMWVTADNPEWQGPVGLTPAGTAPAGAPLATVGQFGDQHDLLFVDGSGLVQGMWESSAPPGWQGPVGLTAPAAAPSAAPIAAFAQSSEQVDVAFVDRNGVVQVIWVTADDPHWQGPVGLTPPGTAAPGGWLAAASQTAAQSD